MTNELDTAIKTFANHSEMTEREAEAYVRRQIAGQSRAEAASLMDISASTVDTQVQKAKPKAKLPNIDVVKRVQPSNTGLEEGLAYEIWFENGAMLRYVWNDSYGEIMETTARADDPHSLYQQVGVAGSEDELEAYALESIAEYMQTYRDDIEACRSDWPDVFEAILCYAA